MSHKGFALIDVISPCVTFNNNDESMRSYGYVKENEITLHMADYIPHFNPVEEIEVPEGHYRDITLHDGSTIRLETISSEHDPADAMAALTALHEAENGKKHVTGPCTLMPANHRLPKTSAWLKSLCWTFPMRCCDPTRPRWMPSMRNSCPDGNSIASYKGPRTTG